MRLTFSGEWSLVNRENLKLSGCIGIIGNTIVEHVCYKLLLFETKNLNIKKKSSWLFKMKKKYKWN